MVKRVHGWLLILPLLLILAGCTVSLQETIPPEPPASAVLPGPGDVVPPPNTGEGVEQPGGDEAGTVPDAELGGEDVTTPNPEGEAEGDAAVPDTEQGTQDGGESAESTPAPQEESTHIVQQGETVGTIAQRYGLTIEELAAANDLLNINRIFVGQELIIPVPGTTLPDEPEPTDPDATPDPSNDIVYIVQPGDNLFRIALNNGLTVEELAAYNKITDPERIEVGQQIRIPQR